MNNELNDAERAQLKADKELFLNIAASDFDNEFEQMEQNATRDSRTGRIIKGGDGPDDQLVVSFSVQPVLSKKETYLAGGAHKYIDMEYITIVVPGNRDLTFHGPVTPFYQWRFPTDYKKFQDGKGAVLTGTPLSLWYEISPSQLKELEYHCIRTVEQIANLSDSNSSALRSFHRMKVKAQSFLDAREDSAKSAALNQQLEESAAKHKSEIDALKEQMAALMSAVTAANEAKSEPKTKK